MHQPRFSITIWLIVTVIVAGSFATTGSVKAECLPGQQQEANLAYASAFEFLKAKNWAQAVPRLESILEVCPTHVNTLRGLGTAYMGIDELDKARDTFILLINVRGEEAEAADYASLGRTYAKLKDYQQARQQYMRASILAPDDCAILFNLGVIHVGVQDYRNAVETLEHTLEECPTVREQVLPQLVKACQKASAKEQSMGNSDRARFYEDKYKQYAGLSGSTTDTYDLVRKLMRENKYDEAILLLQNIVAEKPDHHPAWLSLARCLDHVGRDEDAITAYERRLELRPDDENTTADLIILYAETQNCQKAIRLAGQAQERFQAKGREHLAGIYFGWGMALSCTQEYEAAKEKFRSSISCGVPKWSSPSRQQLARQDELIEFERAKRKKAAQGR